MHQRLPCMGENEFLDAYHCRPICGGLPRMRWGSVEREKGDRHAKVQHFCKAASYVASAESE